MRIRLVIAAAIVTGGGLAACSKPEARLGANSPDARQIRLAEPPPPADSAVVSDLEAHQPLRPVLIRRSAGTVPAARVSVPIITLEPAAPPRMMSLTSTSLAEASPVADLAPAPEAKAVGFGGQIGHGLGAFQLPASEPQTLSGGLRGGGILIRGGMGGIDDKCDTRGGHRGGIAINRITPFGSYPRGGIR